MDSNFLAPTFFASTPQLVFEFLWSLEDYSYMMAYLARKLLKRDQFNVLFLFEVVNREAPLWERHPQILATKKKSHLEVG